MAFDDDDFNIPGSNDDPEIDLDDLLNDDDDEIDSLGDDNESFIDKAKDKYNELKDKYNNTKDKIEKGKEGLNNRKATQDTKKMGDTAKKTADNTKKAADAAKTASQTTKATSGVTKTAKTAQNTAQAAKSVVSKIPPQALIIIVAALAVIIILLIIIIAASAGAAVGAKTNPENMTSNPSITNEYFYGTRSVYIDEQALMSELELSYKEYVIDIIDEIDEQNSNITINIVLPELAEGETLTNDIDLDNHIDTKIVPAIASIVATGNTNSSDVDFSELYQLIDYFGLTSEQVNSVKSFLSEYFTTNNIITSADTINIESIVNSAIESDALSYMYNLCEKVMIKDEIGTEDGLSGIEIRNYIASIYMPNKDIYIVRSSYSIYGGSDEFTNSYKLIEENNGKTTIHAEKEVVGESDIVDGCTDTIELKQFTSINPDNLNLFGSGVSLFKAIRLTPEGYQYFQQIETQNSDKNTITIYTWKPTDASMLYLTFDANSSFIFTEMDLSATSH